jgi:hypothetical protein
MRTIIKNKNEGRRSVLFTVLTISALSLVSTVIQTEHGYAQTRRALFASASQCRQLTDDNVGLCCYALNKKFILTQQQLAMCPPITTSAISASH